MANHHSQYTAFQASARIVQVFEDNAVLWNHAMLLSHPAAIELQ
jgi:hypothetical protein